MGAMKWLAAGLSLLVLMGCASTQVRHPDYGQDCEALSPPGLGNKVDCVRVFYGTNRDIAPSKGVIGSGEVDIFDTSGGAGNELILGRADIWLPKLVYDGGTRELGETPMLKGKVPKNKDELSKYVFVTRITHSGRQRFIEKLRADMTTRQEKSVLLFIHGFNVAFDDALVRSAQLTVDLGQGAMRDPGSPVLFSWPSAGKMSLGQYKRDGGRAAAAVPHLEAFLDILTTNMDVERVNIIAHSMGNRVLVGALESYASDYLETHPNSDVEFRIILAAADVERDIFDQVAGKLGALDPNVVIYTSDDDLALTVSKLVNGKPRLGDTDKNKPYIRSEGGYETVDATSVASELFGLGHGYYSTNPFILGDIRCVLGDTAPTDRALAARRYADLEKGPEFFATEPKIEPFFEECALVRQYAPHKGGDIGFGSSSGSGQGHVVTPAPVVVMPPPIVAPELEPVPLPMAPPPLLPERRVKVLYYDNNISDLTSAQQAYLFDAVFAYGSLERVLIEGYSDSVGVADYNLRLSQVRVKNVQNALIKQGLDPAIIETRSYGETRPQINTGDGVSEVQNRRVVVTFEYQP